MTGKLNFKSSLDNKGKSLSDTKLLSDIQRKPRFHHRNFPAGLGPFGRILHFHHRDQGQNDVLGKLFYPPKKSLLEA